MCACKETDVRESPNDRTFVGGEGQGSPGETCYATLDENPVSSLPERGVLVPPPQKCQKGLQDHIRRYYIPSFMIPVTENYFMMCTSGALSVYAFIIASMRLVFYVAFLIFHHVLGERSAQQRGVTEVSANGDTAAQYNIHMGLIHYKMPTVHFARLK
jgi:hypothetical protein